MRTREWVERRKVCFLEAVRRIDTNSLSQDNMYANNDYYEPPSEIPLSERISNGRVFSQESEERSIEHVCYNELAVLSTGINGWAKVGTSLLICFLFTSKVYTTSVIRSMVS